MVLKKIFITLLLITTIITSCLSQVSGTLKYHRGQQIQLLGYNGFETIELANSIIDSKGNFSLTYDNSYKGMAYIETKDKSNLFIVLNEKQIRLIGTHLKEPDSIQFIKSKENQLFEEYAKDHAQRENALAGWKHLLPQYKSTPIFNSEKKQLNVIQSEIKRIETEDAKYIKNLDQTTYVSWFLPLRKLLGDMPLSAQRYTNRIPKHIKDFHTINFNETKLYHSGILDDLIEGHYLLLENMGKPLETMYQEMNLSTDYLISNIEGNDKLLNEVTAFLFDLLEKRSLFKASEYLALQLLSQSNCKLNDDLANELESYRKMKIGNIAPDIVFSGKKIIRNIEIPTNLKLSEMNNNYTLMVFGASWCSKCKQELPKMIPYYNKWKSKGIEIAFVALDTEEKEYTEFVKNFPWLSSCDFKSWNTQAAKDYYVFSTPIMFLIDKNRKILLRPSTIEQVDSWIDFQKI